MRSQVKLPPKNHFFKTTSPNESFVISFCRLFEEELLFRKKKGLDTLPFRVYYKNMLTDEGRMIPISVFGYSQRLLPAIEECDVLKGNGRILDAGCGYGTESLLFSLMGNEVIGIDLVPERIELGQSRVSFYQSISDFPLRLKFISANIFSFLEDAEPFDIIWLMEAISHIYPADKFLDLISDKLKEGGKLIITDPNSINPIAWVRSAKIRGSLRHKPHKKFRDPDSGIPVEYGQEQIYSVFGIKKVLVKAGLKIIKTKMSGFMGTSFFPHSLLNKKPVFLFFSLGHRIIKNIPLIKFGGATYTIVAAKEE